MIGPNRLAARFKEDFDNLHALIEDFPAGKTKEKIEKAAALAHEAMDRLYKLALEEKHPKGGDIVTPFSGGEPKPNP